MKTEFINIAANELRTPIQPILGVTEILKSRHHEGRSGSLEITDKQLAMMDRNARRLQRLSSEILDATKIEAGTLKLDKEVIDINTEVKNVIADIMTLIPENRYVHIYFKPSVDESGNPSPLLVNADKLRMFEVISNLIRNAITFSSTGRKDGIITITTEKSGGRVDDKEQGREGEEGKGEVWVSISDQGTGIATDLLPRLFTRFTADRERGGTGLGLYIAKNIIEAHGGRIWAENNADGMGATFRFTLPCT